MTAAQVADRVARGQRNLTANRSGRTWWQIIRANVFTRLNAMVAVLFAVILVVGPLVDGLFALLVVVNTAVGIVQEIRAKLTLDRLAVVADAQQRVRRDGETRQVAAADVVIDDVLVLSAGDQVVVDARVLTSTGLEADESLLTGEAEPVAKTSGDELRSGSFVAAGGAMVRATAVGEDSYAAQLAAEASRYAPARSELMDGLNRVLRVITYLLLPVGAITIVGQLTANPDFAEALRRMVAALVPLVPEGLLLIASTAFALGVIRLGRRGCLVRELPAVEGLARVDVLCADKTGTLTTAELRVVDVLPIAARTSDTHPIDTHPIDAHSIDAHSIDTHPVGADLIDADAEVVAAESVAEEVVRIRTALAAVSHAAAGGDDRANPTAAAIAEYADEPTPDWNPVARAVFSARRGWSGATFAGRGSWILGAPDVLLAPIAGGASDEPTGVRAALHAERAEALRAATELAATGRRVLVLARSAVIVDDVAAPGLVRPVALVVLEQKIRPEVARTLAYFADEDVDVKIISGDHPRSVAAVAAAAGLPTGDTTTDSTGGSNGGSSSGSNAVDARDLPAEPAALAAELDRRGQPSIFGRVRPARKRELVNAYQAAGHTVAMTGDGVNDVLALKDADVPIAMGSGSAASRAVAPVVLLNDDFSVLPRIVAEGRRVIGNIERAAKLFLVKTWYSALLGVLATVAAVPFPFLPRHLTLLTTFTIYLPSILLALQPGGQRARSGFVRRTLAFSIPVGAIVAVATFVAYLWARGAGANQIQAGTSAAIALFLVSMAALVLVSRPLDRWRSAVLAGTTLAAIAAAALEPLRAFFALDFSHPTAVYAALVAGAAGAFLTAVADQLPRRLASRAAIGSS